MIFRIELIPFEDSTVVRMPWNDNFDDVEYAITSARQALINDANMEYVNVWKEDVQFEQAIWHLVATIKRF